MPLQLHEKNSVLCLSENMNSIAFSNSHIHQSPLSTIPSVLCLILPVGSTFRSRFLCPLKALESEIDFLQGIHNSNVTPGQLNGS